jgi:hypothetical protein
MLVTTRKEILPLVFLALCFSFLSCDSGSSNSSPAWVGEWNQTSSDSYVSDSTSIYWSLSKKEMKLIRDTRNNPDFEEPCELVRLVVSNRDGNVVTYNGETPDIGGQTYRFRFDASGGTLTATLLDSPEEEAGYLADATLESVDGIPIPQDEESCQLD